MKIQLLILALGFTTLTSSPAKGLSEDQINENSIMLVQAFMNLPESYIGGVALKDRGKFLSLVSHYGDIDFAKGYFQLRGDGARAHDTPASRFFQIKLLPREKDRPLCVISRGRGSEAPLSIISFGPYWRWEDVTKQYLPESLNLAPSWTFKFSPGNNTAVACKTEKHTINDKPSFRAGPMTGMLVWKQDRFSFEPFNPSAFFRSAILEIPPKYFADIPLNQRTLLMSQIEDDKERFEPNHGWLHYFSDSSTVSATSMIWAKLLERSLGQPYLFVHMAKPFSNGQAPDETQTYVLKRDGQKWVEMETMLKRRRVDLTGHFRTRRDQTIETGSWKKIDRQDGEGKVWTFGMRKIDLKWNYRYFYESRAESETFTKN